MHKQVRQQQFHTLSPHDGPQAHCNAVKFETHYPSNQQNHVMQLPRLSTTELISRQDTLTELWFYVPLNTKQVNSETFPKPISWLDMEKLNLTQQKHTFTNQN